MGHHVLTDASVEWNGVDLSDDVKSVTLDYSIGEEDDSNMGDTAVGRLPALEDVTGSMDLDQDYDAGRVDATLMASKRTVVTVTIKPTSGALSATNPGYTGSAFWTSYPPISGEHGTKHRVSVSFVGSGAWTRIVA